MNNQTRIFAIAITIAAVGSVAITNLSISAFAEGKLPESGFGQASKNLATSEPGARGELTRAGSLAGEPPFDKYDDELGRKGIGNLAREAGLSVGEYGCDFGKLQC